MRHEALNVLHVDSGNGLVAALLSRDFARVAAVEVILTTVALQELSTLCDLDPLRDGLVCLEFRHRSGLLALASDNGRDVSSLLFNFLFRIQRVVRGDAVQKILDAFCGEFSVGFFASAEDDFDFELLAFFEEGESLLSSNIHIVLAHLDRETNAFDLDFFRVCLLLAHLLILLIFEGAEIEELTDGRVFFRGNLDEVVFALVGECDGLGCFHDPEKCSVLVNDANLWHVDLAVGPILWREIALRLSPSVVNTHY